MNLMMRKSQKTCEVLDTSPPSPFTVRELIRIVLRPALSAREPQKYPPTIIPAGRNSRQPSYLQEETDVLNQMAVKFEQKHSPFHFLFLPTHFDNPWPWNPKIALFQNHYNLTKKNIYPATIMSKITWFLVLFFIFY